MDKKSMNKFLLHNIGCHIGIKDFYPNIYAFMNIFERLLHI